MIQMQKIVRTVLFRMFPEMEQKLHLVQFGIIKGIPPVPKGSEVYKWEEPYVGVDIQLLDEFDKPFGPIYTGVPYPTPAGDSGRGFYGFPQVGTRVTIQYAYGDPERPLITNAYMFDKHLPKLLEKEILVQQNPATFLRANEDETWIHKARNHYDGEFTNFSLKLRGKLKLGVSVDLVAECHELADIVKSIANKVGATSEASRAKAVKDKINTIKT
jgi:hypothetical protein